MRLLSAGSGGIRCEGCFKTAVLKILLARTNASEVFFICKKVNNFVIDRAKRL